MICIPVPGNAIPYDLRILPQLSKAHACDTCSIDLHIHRLRPAERNNRTRSPIDIDLPDTMDDSLFFATHIEKEEDNIIIVTTLQQKCF